MAINTALLAKLKSAKFKDIVAAGAGAATGMGIGVMTNAGMNPTKSDKNNQGNQSGTDGDVLAPAPMPAPAATNAPSPGEMRSQVETPSLKGAGETDIISQLPKIFESLDPVQARALERNIQAQLIMTEATERAALAKSREKSARDIELQNIQAWRDITTAQINREAAMGLGMAEIAFRATQANPGVLTALAPFAQAGVSAFK